ncbi:Guanine nucleotide-binding protein alpha-4 subunit like [Actinidia chinensis var. chinensis]|uniref:Guanine nucleotide-binding protein alpha-4 subunit like n=1 Tax=Actinidia chinensis var. chinensis TaxID=1590841 RepID=A0A2R6P8H3_ACTCC|nr:Guanine nucleotide-binding protein alpha-4 subunit like [Actinidia chinensis var. chinensis]
MVRSINCSQFCATHRPFLGTRKMSRKMREVAVGLVMVLLLAVQIPSGLSLQSTVPAFLWSPQEDGFSNNQVKEAVNYQTLSPKDLAKSVLSEGGWSNLLCLGKEIQHPVDVALLFVGREVRIFNPEEKRNKN